MFAKIHNATDFKEMLDLANCDKFESAANVELQPLCMTCLYMSMEDSPETIRDIRRLTRARMWC